MSTESPIMTMPLTPAAIEQRRRGLADSSGRRVDLAITRNRVRMISVAYVSEGHVRLRMHEQFLHAPAAVFQALANYLRTRRRTEWAVVAAFARQIVVPASSPVPRRRTPMVAKGQVYDLQAIADAVNARFFEGQIAFEIGWGPRRRRSSRRRPRSIRYGSWTVATRTVRINPLLDDPRVPHEFVEYIVFHELLHAVVESYQQGDRRIDHGKTFRQREAEYPDIRRMRQMSKQLLSLNDPSFTSRSFLLNLAD